MTTIESGLEPHRGRQAEAPSHLPWLGWKDILWRVSAELGEDRITLIAAGATFYLLLALFPALAAFVSLYGFVADPVTIADQIAFLGTVLPSGGVELIRTQLESLAQQNDAALSFGFIFGLLFALWSANNGIKTVFEALNVAYEEREKRSFLRLTLISFLFTLGAIIVGILFIIGVGVVPAVIAFVGLGGWEEVLISVLRWPVLLIVAALAISVLYRFGPSREYAQWRWLSWGGLLAAVLWLLASVLFSWYLSNFANYNATYGSLGAVIGFMIWTWISMVILLAGAELNSEMEHQTAVDTTTGAPRPMGERGATMADTLGVTSEQGKREAPKAFDPSRRRSLGPDDLHRGDREPALSRSRWSAGSILGAAVAGAAVAGLAALEVRDQINARSTRPGGKPRRIPDDMKPRRSARAEPDAGSRRRAALAKWVRHGRTFIESPTGRSLMERALRTFTRPRA